MEKLVAYHIAKNRVRTVEDAVEEWSFDHEDAMTAYNAQDLILESIAIAEQLYTNINRFEAIATSDLTDGCVIAHRWDDLLANMLPLLVLVRTIADHVVSKGFELTQRDNLDFAIQQLRQRRDHLQQSWGLIDRNAVEASLQQYENGQYSEL